MAAEPPFRFKTTILPKLTINPNALKFKAESQDNLFASAQELSAKYQERISELECIKDMRNKRQAAKDSYTKQAIDESLSRMKIQREANNQNRQSVIMTEGKRLVKIQQMIEFCDRLDDVDSACFYLETQQWDLDKAVAFYCDCTGSVDTRKESKLTIHFKLPDNKAVTKEFDPQQLLWSMFPAIYEILPNDRSVVLKLANSEWPITEESMTTLSYKEYGFPSPAVVNVEFSN